MERERREHRTNASLGDAVLLVLHLLGCAALGCIAGAWLGFLGLPALCYLLLSPAYEIQPWDGQFVGEAVGILIGLYVFLQRNRR